MKNLLNDLKIVINKYQNSDKDTQLLCYKDYQDIINLLNNCSCDIDILNIIPSNKSFNDKLDIDKEYITNEIYNNRALLYSLYNKLIDAISSFEIDEDEYNIPNNSIDILKDFFNNYHFGDIFNELLNNNEIIENDDFIQPTTLNLKSINKQYIFLSSDKLLDSLPHEVGHVIENKYISKDNHLLLEFNSILMELLFIDYYSNIDKEASDIMKNNFISNLFFLLLNTISQLELMNRYPDSFINMNLNNKYLDEYNSMLLFNNHMDKDQLYLQYYLIGLLLAIKYYYIVKDNKDFNEVINFIENNKDKPLNELLNNIDISLINRFINEYISDNKKASK